MCLRRTELRPTEPIAPSSTCHPLRNRHHAGEGARGHVSVSARRILGCGDSEQQLLGGAFDVQWQIPESLPGVTLCSQLPQLGNPMRRLLMVPSWAQKA